ncbi:hypothetical protein [Burkholderia glumae]|uniref:hypothetical protein n=1 Tax=Burkholderia glumae TaxID=337 RepID=UPI0021510BC0|nr:hypothetical protein [Burkholderia glumae]
MSEKYNEDLGTTKRDHIIWDHLRANGLFSIEDAPDEILEEAMAIADRMLGKGNDN